MRRQTPVSAYYHEVRKALLKMLHGRLSKKRKEELFERMKINLCNERYRRPLWELGMKKYPPGKFAEYVMYALHWYLGNGPLHDALVAAIAQGMFPKAVYVRYGRREFRAMANRNFREDFRFVRAVRMKRARSRRPSGVRAANWKRSRMGRF